jgi:hypothetical protein
MITVLPLAICRQRVAELTPSVSAIRSICGVIIPVLACSTSVFIVHSFGNIRLFVGGQRIWIVDFHVRTGILPVLLRVLLTGCGIKMGVNQRGMKVRKKSKKIRITLLPDV